MNSEVNDSSSRSTLRISLRIRVNDKTEIQFAEEVINFAFSFFEKTRDIDGNIGKRFKLRIRSQKMELGNFPNKKENRFKYISIYID